MQSRYRAKLRWFSEQIAGRVTSAGSKLCGDTSGNPNMKAAVQEACDARRAMDTLKAFTDVSALEEQWVVLAKQIRQAQDLIFTQLAAELQAFERGDGCVQLIQHMLDAEVARCNVLTPEESGPLLSQCCRLVGDHFGNRVRTMCDACADYHLSKCDSAAQKRRLSTLEMLLTVIGELQADKCALFTSLLSVSAGSKGYTGADRLCVAVKEAVAKARENEELQAAQLTAKAISQVGSGEFDKAWVAVGDLRDNAELNAERMGRAMQEIVSCAKSKLKDLESNFRSSLQRELLAEALSALKQVRLLSCFADGFADAYERLNSEWLARCSKVVQKMNGHLRLRQYSKLVQLLTEQAQLQSSASDVAERNAASENLTCCVTTLTDHLQDIYEGARRELPRLSKAFVRADALARLSDMLSEIDEAIAIAGFIDKLKVWRDELHCVRDGHVERLHYKAREQLRSHKFYRFDQLFGYLSTICEQLYCADQDLLDPLNAAFTFELGRCDDFFAFALKSGDHCQVDQILRSLDFVSVVSRRSDSVDLRSDICESCSAKSRELLQRLHVEFEKLCKHAEKCLLVSNLEICKAYECLKHLGKLQSSDFMRRETVEEYSRLRDLFKLVKEGLLTKREILNNAASVNKCANEFKAIDAQFFRRRLDNCLDELRAGVDACRRGLRDEDLDSSAVNELKSTIGELVNYETALKGLGCDAEIERNKKDLFDELKDTILQSLDTIDAKMEEGKWNEVDRLNKFVKFAFDDVLKSCNWSSDEERGTLGVAIEKRMVNLDEKGARDCGADQLCVDVKKAVAKARQNEAATKAEAEKRRMAELERQFECQQVWSQGFRTALLDSARPACT